MRAHKTIITRRAVFDCRVFGTPKDSSAIFEHPTGEDVIRCDGTAVNTGWENCPIGRIEIHSGKPLKPAQFAAAAKNHK